MNVFSRWLERRAPAAKDSMSRWVVLDTETTGLDPDSDSLLAIGAVAVDDEGIRASDSFEIVLRHDGDIDADNVVVHGLGRATLDAGVAPSSALAAFREWVNGVPCIAFHADFDRRVLERAARLAGVRPLAGPWLDLAPLAAALRPEIARKRAVALDDWLSVYEIACASRHNAANDAFAAAELLLRLKADAAGKGNVGFERLHALVRNRRWLGHER